MFKQLFLSVSLLCIGAVGVFAFSADDLNKIVFVNNLGGGQNIDYIFLSPGDSQYWGPDVLDKEHSLEKGSRIEFFVFYPEKVGKFDFMAVDEKGAVYEIKDIEIKDGKEKTVSITEKTKTKKTLESLKLTEIELSNKTGQNIDYVFLAPSDSKIWGIELLSTERSLDKNTTVSFLVPLAQESFDMDFLAIGVDETHYEKKVTVGTEEATLTCAISVDDINADTSESP